MSFNHWIRFQPDSRFKKYMSAYHTHDEYFMWSDLRRRIICHWGLNKTILREGAAQFQKYTIAIKSSPVV